MESWLTGASLALDLVSLVGSLLHFITHPPTIIRQHPRKASASTLASAHLCDRRLAHPSRSSLPRDGAPRPAVSVILGRPFLLRSPRCSGVVPWACSQAPWTFRRILCLAFASFGRIRLSLRNRKCTKYILDLFRIAIGSNIVEASRICHASVVCLSSSVSFSRRSKNWHCSCLRDMPLSAIHQSVVALAVCSVDPDLSRRIVKLKAIIYHANRARRNLS
ncbi:hypothetical protein BJX62DRAFT_204016 [Aspergillus germanicus]